jgi:tetratricopeptide (TPR) repeat protein
MFQSTIGHEHGWQRGWNVDWKKRGADYFAAKKWQRAAEAYTEALERLPHDAEKLERAKLLSNRSVSRLRAGAPAQALVDAGRCIELAPRWPRGHERRLAALGALGRDDAEELADAHKEHGNALRAEARLDEALAAYDRAVAADESCAKAHSNRGLVLVQLGRREEGADAFSLAMVLAREAGDKELAERAERRMHAALGDDGDDEEWDAYVDLFVDEVKEAEPSSPSDQPQKKLQKRKKKRKKKKGKK